MARTKTLNPMPVAAMRSAFAAALLIGASTVSALPVHIQVDRGGGPEYGAGFSVGKESECFIVTPFHVIEGADGEDITITDAKGRRANATVVKAIQDFDAALLKVTGQVTIDCPADWDDGGNSSNDIEGASFLISKKVNSNGRTEQNRLFVSGISAEIIDLEPFDDRNKLQEGDSGSSIYAGQRLVGMVTSVETATGAITALTQSQIHGLFGGDVLVKGQRVAVVYPFIYNRAENVYATMAAFDYIGQRTPLAVMESAPMTPQQIATGMLPAVPPGVDYTVAGSIVELTSQRIANPHYNPQNANKKKSFGDIFVDSLKKSVTKIDESVRYLRVYNIDVEVTVIDVAGNSRARNLERRSYQVPDDGANARELEKSAIRSAVIESLELTFRKYGLPLIQKKT